MSDDIATLTARAEAAERERDELAERVAALEAVFSDATGDLPSRVMPRLGSMPRDDLWRASVLSYRKQRAAEAKLAKAVEALRPFADIAEAADRLTVTMGRHRRFEVVRNRISCAMVDAARATLAELTDTGEMGG